MPALEWLAETPRPNWEDAPAGFRETALYYLRRDHLVKNDATMWTAPTISGIGRVVLREFLCSPEKEKECFTVWSEEDVPPSHRLGGVAKGKVLDRGLVISDILPYGQFKDDANVKESRRSYVPKGYKTGPRSWCYAYADIVEIKERIDAEEE